MAKYTAQFQLLEYGLVDEALDVGRAQLQRPLGDAEGEEEAPAAPLETVEEFVQRLVASTREHIKRAQRKGVRKGAQHGSAEYSARRDLRNAFLKDIMRRRCERCQAYVSG